VNRFCAFQILGVEKYKGDMDEFLAKALEYMNQAGEDQLRTLSRQFQTALENNKEVFGNQAFRKHSPGKTNRNVINASLWDVMTTGLSRYAQDDVVRKNEALKSGLYNLFEDDEFFESITMGTSQVNRVRVRFEKSRQMFREVFDDHQD